MQTEPIAFIINPISGGLRNIRIEKSIRKKLSAVYHPVFVYTEYPQHAIELTKTFLSKRFRLIVAVGGDGTINEVATSLIGKGATLGIIPTGSGNGLARHFRIPLRINKSIGVLNKGKIIQVDVGKIQKKHFFCTSGFGFDARISKRFAITKKRGFMGYAYWSISEFRNYTPKRFKLLIDDKPYTIKAFLFTVANANQYGNNVKIAPQASIFDGMFDVSFLKPFPWWCIFSIGWKMVRGKIESSKYYSSIKAKKIKILRKKPYICHVDGEPFKLKKTAEIKILPLKLNIMVPFDYLK